MVPTPLCRDFHWAVNHRDVEFTIETEEQCYETYTHSKLSLLLMHAHASSSQLAVLIPDDYKYNYVLILAVGETRIAKNSQYFVFVETSNKQGAWLSSGT